MSSLLLLAVDLPYAYYFIEVENDVVVNSAPIGRWMIGKRLDQVKEWAESKGGRIGEVAN